MTFSDNELNTAFHKLESGTYAALETYSNVHRGNGHFSIVSTHLYEQARSIVLEYLGLARRKYVVVFSSALRAGSLVKQLKPGSFKMVSSAEIGLSIGVYALAIMKNAIPKGIPSQTGGGTTKLISKDWVIWADAPDKFEAGTPAIINVITFARALLIVQKYGNSVFQESYHIKLSVSQVLHEDELKELTGIELLANLKKTHIGKGITVPCIAGSTTFINLDNSASTPSFVPIWDTFMRTLKQSSAVHKEIVQEVRSICAGFLGAPESRYDMIFTSNTTEAINLVAESLGHEGEQNVESVILNTIMEHSSNDLPWRMLPKSSIIRLSVDSEGFINSEELFRILNEYNEIGLHGNKRVRLVSICGASNVLGSCNDLAEISQITHKYGAELMVDAAQLVSHRKVDMETWGVDYLTFSAHKIYSPFGTGGLIARRGLLKFSPDDLEKIQEEGEENVAGIASLGKAMELLQRIGMNHIQNEEQEMTKILINELSKVEGLKIHGVSSSDSERFNQKLGVVVFDLKKMMAHGVSKFLSQQGGIGVRSGCHCAHIIIKHILNISPGLERFQRIMQTIFPKMSFPGVTRVSLGIENSEADIKFLIEVLNKINNKSSKTSKFEMKDFVDQRYTKVYSIDE